MLEIKNIYIKVECHICSSLKALLRVFFRSCREFFIRRKSENIQSDAEREISSGQNKERTEKLRRYLSLLYNSKEI